MSHCKGIIMKNIAYDSPRTNNMEKVSAVEPKTSPVKEPSPIKPQCSPVSVTTVVFSPKNNTSAIHNKENSTGMVHNRTLEFEDSGYLSLQNSHIDCPHENEEDDQILEKPTVVLPAAIHSPSKCQEKNTPSQLEAICTPVDRPRRRTAAYSLSSTPSDHHSNTNLPILNFQRVVCEELAKSFDKNKRYDWSIVQKVADDFLLDRVIGRQMGLEYVDIFQCLLARNMRCILTNILALLEDLDLVSCKKVSRTWRKIICEDTAARRRCQRAEQELRESRSSLRQRGVGLTRDVAISRVVLSCMQTMASSKAQSSSSSSSCIITRRAAGSQKGSTPNSHYSRFDEYMQAASTLKQHESLRACRRCGSPAKHLDEVQKATCTSLSCLFVFCTCCQEAFHGSNPCRTVTPRAHFHKTAPLIPGSARSKRNIRRL